MLALSPVCTVIGVYIQFALLHYNVIMVSLT